MQDAFRVYIYPSGRRYGKAAASAPAAEAGICTECHGPVFVLYIHYTYDICKRMSGTAGSYRVICRQFYHNAGSSLFIGICTVSCMQSDPRQSSRTGIKKRREMNA